MRGRGFMIRQSAPAPSTGASLLGPGAGLLGTTAGGLNAPSRADIFRSRPQNTSRPPSLHVDDFNKLEKDEGTSTSGEVIKPTDKSQVGTHSTFNTSY